MSGNLLTDKVIAVTGAASGIGRATAILAADEGAAGIVVTDRDRDGLEQTVAEIESRGVAVAAHVAPIDQGDAPDRLVALAVEQFGRLDAAVNNAGIRGRLATIDEVDDELWDEVLNVNLRSVLRCARAELRQMYAQGNGAIVNVASAVLFGFQRQLAPYAASKAGVVAMTKVAAVEAGPRGVRVNAVCPGRTGTPLFNAHARGDGPPLEKLVAAIPLGRTAEPVELANAMIWLCSDRSSFVHGEVLVVDGGRTVS